MKDTTEAIIVYATFPNRESAVEVAEALINARLGACINLLPGMTSVYRWEGCVETAEEVVMIVKTRAALREDVVLLMEDRHPYDTPAILVLDVVGGSQRYLDWIVDETKDPSKA